MIDEIKAVKQEVEHNGQTYELEPMEFEDSMAVEEMVGDNASEVEETKAMLNVQLADIDGLEYGEDDSIDDVQLGFLIKVVQAMREANGLEGFTEDQVRQAQNLAR